MLEYAVKIQQSTSIATIIYKIEVFYIKIVGIVSEYNPFHNGHLYQLKKTKKLTGADGIVAIMSGNFTQRGEPAIFDKLIRAESAVKSGIDLVLELPTCYALSSAEFFAYGAVKSLDSLGVIDILSFGSESGDINLLKNTAKAIILPDTQAKIKENIKSGIPIFTAISNSIGNEFKDIMSTPNNILAIEYLKASIKINSKITPFTVKREFAEYHSHEIYGNFASATAIRALLKDNKNVENILPRTSFEVYKRAINDGFEPIFEDSFEKAVIYSLRIKSAEEITKYADVTEGLENKIKSAALKYDKIEDIVMAVKSKRYSYTRLRRIIYNIFLNIDKNLRTQDPEYIRVLAFNKTGQSILNQAKKVSFLPIITNVKRNHNFNGLDLDIKASQIYSLGYKYNKEEKSGLIAINAEK